MMQMTETHPERKRVRSVFQSQSWGDGEVRITPERSGRMKVRNYLMLMGQVKVGSGVRQLPDADGAGEGREWG